MKWYPTGVTFTEQPFIRKISVDGRRICLVGYQGEIYALDTRCPHAGEDLSRGWCEEGKIVCPVHRYSYHLQTGRGSQGQNDYVNIYPVMIKDGEITVGFESFKEKLKKIFNLK